MITLIKPRLHTDCIINEGIKKMLPLIETSDGYFILKTYKALLKQTWHDIKILIPAYSFALSMGNSIILRF